MAVKKRQYIFFTHGDVKARKKEKQAVDGGSVWTLILRPYFPLKFYCDQRAWNRKRQQYSGPQYT